MNNQAADNVMNNDPNNGTQTSNTGKPNKKPNPQSASIMQTIFRNIGTPSFKLSQIPQQYLQNLTPQQLQMIQNRHQQLLYARMQQQQAQNSQASTPQEQVSAANKISTQRKPASNAPSPAVQENQQNHAFQQSNSTPTAFHNSPPNSSTGSVNPNTGGVPPTLPPQIAQLPLASQQQVLQTLKQQAIAKNNPAVVAAITAAEQHVKNLLEQQDQQNTGSKSQTKMTANKQGSRVVNQKMTTAANYVPESPGITNQIPPMALPQNIPPPQIDMRKYELPSFQTINYDPPETKLPNPSYWSSRNPTTDILLYEQITQRDKANVSAQHREVNGYDPFSIYGFSNKEYVSKLWHTLKYYQDLKTTRMKSITNTSQNIPTASIWGNGYSGYGNGITNTTTKVVPFHPVAGRNFYSPDKIKLYKQAMSEDAENLVPVRLEFDLERDKFFLRDTLLWNRNESVVDINEFVEDMVADYQFDTSIKRHAIDMISQSIKEQVQEYQPNPFIEEHLSRIGGDDMRITIKLDIVVGQTQLIDQFEWDLSNPDNSPEEFAECMCRELELPGEFVSAIAHSIREQVHMYHKSLIMLGYGFDGGIVEDDDIRSRILPVVTVDDVYRPPADCKVFTPNILQISPAELERLDKDKDRDTRPKRRQGRFSRRGNTNIGGMSMSSTNANASAANNSSVGGEATLPDIADIPRTFRTPIPSTILPGGVDLGPSVFSYNLETSVEYQSRGPPPEPVMPPCYVVDHIPGKSMLVSIKLPQKTAAPLAVEQHDQHFGGDSTNTDVPIKKEDDNISAEAAPSMQNISNPSQTIQAASEVPEDKREQDIDAITPIVESQTEEKKEEPETATENSEKIEDKETMDKVVEAESGEKQVVSEQELNSHIDEKLDGEKPPVDSTDIKKVGESEEVNGTPPLEVNTTQKEAKSPSDEVPQSIESGMKSSEEENKEGSSNDNRLESENINTSNENDNADTEVAGKDNEETEVAGKDNKETEVAGKDNEETEATRMGSEESGNQSDDNQTHNETTEKPDTDNTDGQEKTQL